MNQNSRFFIFQDWTEALRARPSEAAIVAQVPPDLSNKEELRPSGNLARKVRVRFPILFSTTPWQTTLLDMTQRTSLCVPIAGFDYDFILMRLRVKADDKVWENMLSTPE